MIKTISAHRFLAIYLLLYAATCLFLLSYTSCFVDINDFWGLYIAAEKLQLNDPRTWYNGYFPIAYILVLKLFIWSCSPIFLSFAFSLISSLLLFVPVYLLTLKFTGKKIWGILSVIFLSLHPFYWQYVLMPGPYTAFDLLMFTGVFIYLTNSNIKNLKPYLFAGLAIGAASLFRYHGILFLPGILLCIFLFGENKAKRSFAFLSGFLLMLQMQIIVNLFAGRGILETNQSLSLASVNWYHLNPYEFHPTIIQEFLTDPILFTKIFIWKAMGRIYILLPVAALIFLLKDVIHRIIALKILIIFVIYFLGVNVHMSPRSELTIIPFFVISMVTILGILFHKFTPKVSTVNYTASTVAVVIMAILVFNFTEVINARVNSSMHFQQVENIISESSGGSYVPNQVFATDFEIYFPGNKPYYLYKNGGWLRREKIYHDKLFPNLSIKHIDSFKADCLAKDINYIVLDKESGHLANFLEELFNGKTIEGFDEIGISGEFKIFAIE